MITPAAAPTEKRTFDARKAELLADHPGQFALVCGQQLVAVCSSLEEGLQLAALAFDAGTIEAGAPILISEIADVVRVRVVAEPRSR
jgi:hypothetical protein